MDKETRFKVDYESFLSHQDIIYHSPVEPHKRKPGENFIDGPLMGNGDLGAVAHGTGEKFLINVGKNDVWDRREVKLARPPLIQNEFINMILGDKDGSGLKGLKEISKILHIPYEKVYPCPKPVGQIILNNYTLKESSFYQKLSLYNALLSSQFKTNNSQAKISTFVTAEENLILTKYMYKGKRPLNLTVDLYRWKDREDKTMTSPTFGCDEKYFWIRYRFPKDALYPEGFEYVMLGTIKGAKYETKTLQNRARTIIHGEKSGEVEIYVSVATSRDAKEPLKEAKRIIEEVMEKGYEYIFSKHKNWWHSFWNKSFISLSDELMEKLWYTNQYFLACCSKKDKIAPGLYGNWIISDSSWWHGDYHLNYNFEQQYWGVYSSNHTELAYPYYDLISRILPMAKKEAREIYNQRGAKYPLTAYPTQMDKNPYPAIPWDRCMCLSAWVTQGFWWHYQYTLDKDFLQKKAYPLMVECLRFYQDFMKKENGKYVIWPTVSPEHWGITKNFKYNRNCIIDLALIKFLLRATIEASQILNVNKEEREIWKDMLENITDYPTYKSPEGKIFVDVEDAYPIIYNYPVPTAPVFPGEDIGMDSPKEVYEIAKRTAKNIRTNGNDSYIALPMAWMRLGLKEMYKLFRKMTLQRVRRNSCLKMYPALPNAGPVVENFAYTAVINEMLLQSYNGKIRVFPALPDNLSAQIANLRAVGAFLVSSEVEKSKVKYISLKSLKGSNCIIVNPWKEKNIRIRDMTKGKKEIKYTFKENEIAFKTKEGHIYVVDRRHTSFESFPMVILKGKERSGE